MISTRDAVHAGQVISLATSVCEFISPARLHVADGSCYAGTMPLREIAGHQRLLPLIARAAAHATVPPSMLFAGPRGVGKSRTATAVAEALNCLQPATSHLFAIDGCGACA